MGLIIGPTPWWQSNLITLCPVGTTLPDGSRIMCKAGGTAWIVAPSCTEVTQTWNGTTNTLVGNKCCICDWSTLNTRLISCGFNPCDWFVPSYTQLSNPGYVCRTLWDTFGPSCDYWSSTEFDANRAARLIRSTGGCATSFGYGGASKPRSYSVRAFRCVTY